MEIDLSLSVPENKLKTFLSKQNEKLLKLLSTQKPLQQITSLPSNYKNTPIDLSQSSSGNYSQYTSVYISRLKKCYSSLKKQAMNKWNGIKICDNILDLKGKEEKAIIGITYKELGMKPSILKGVEAMVGIRKIESFVNEDEDFLALEDSSGRIKINSELSTCIKVNEIITGIPVAMKGCLDEKGLFIVNDYEFYNNIDNNAAPMTIKEGNDVILFISGLHIGSDDQNGKNAIARQLLMEFIQGKNKSNVLNDLSSTLTRVIICGDSIYSPPETEMVEKGSFSKAELNVKVYKAILDNYDSFDNYLNILSHYIPVDVMSGIDDNSTIFFPDTAINKVMLPRCKNALNKTLNLVGNPYLFTLNDLAFIGTSGENVDNIRQCSSIGNTMDIMQSTLRWGHLAPSAPNDLRSYPFDNDPMVIESIPDVYFVGGQKSFEKKIVDVNGRKVMMISIPEFSSTHSAVIYNTKTEEVKEINFSMI